MALLRFLRDHLTPLVASGKKRATLRRRGHRVPKVGERATLMYGTGRLVDPDPLVSGVDLVDVSIRSGRLAIAQNGIALSGADVAALAAELGHESAEAAAEYYSGLNGDEFEGVVIRW